MASRLALSAARRQLFAGARQPAARAYSAEASTGNAFLEERRHIKEHAASETKSSTVLGFGRSER